MDIRCEFVDGRCQICRPRNATMRAPTAGIAFMVLHLGVAWSAEPCAPATDAQIYAARAAMDLVLFDSQSARFRDVCARRTPGAPGKTSVCGLVNAKNRYGAYVGFARFGYVLGAVKATVVQGEGGERAVSEVFYCGACTETIDVCLNRAAKKPR